MQEDSKQSEPQVASPQAQPSLPSESKPPNNDWHFISPPQKLPSRFHFKLKSRYLTLLHFPPHWHCMDSICYHAGGPLTDGSFKKIGNRSCLECPWHRYLVDIKTGEGLYMDLDRRYRSKGVRQRVHEVKVDERGVWVKINEGGEVASDEYAHGPKFGEGRKVTEIGCGKELEW